MKSTRKSKGQPATHKVMNFSFMPEKIMTLMSKERLKNLESTWDEYDKGLNISQFV